MRLKDIAVDVPVADVRQPTTLRMRLNEALASTPANGQRVQPPRRIASVPTSEVIGYRLGAAGPCPVKG